ncbi:MAG: DUF6531 domain-containing protein [Acidimicrobiia bacterium]|nr:DUF6531 domain-containing protein [Acidimicrobiia bacterium]
MATDEDADDDNIKTAAEAALGDGRLVSFVLRSASNAVDDYKNFSLDSGGELFDIHALEHNPQDLLFETMQTCAVAAQLDEGAGRARGTGSHLPIEGDPVNVATGSLIVERTDIAASAEVAAIKRTYDSRSPTDGVFGKGWASPLDARVWSTTDANGVEFIRYRDAAGRVNLYAPHPTEDDTWVSESQPHIQIRDDYEVTKQSGEVVRFDISSGRVIERVSPDGEFVTVDWDPTGGVLARVEQFGSEARVWCMVSICLEVQR